MESKKDHLIVMAIWHWKVLLKNREHLILKPT